MQLLNSWTWYFLPLQALIAVSFGDWPHYLVEALAQH